MTLAELYQIKISIERSVNYFSEDDKYYFPLTYKNNQECLTIIQREINLKEMDPRKSDDIEIRSYEHKLISNELSDKCICPNNKYSDPACTKHGIAQQLNKSQME